ncbi:GNAT family N-acetyltransferase [Alcaligenaceae bacterium B3P038]|nr:GNAT family N-acetyltransferase [Alcaligenaceae bacterium B3P038]
MQKEPEILKIELATVDVDLGCLTALLHRAYAELGDMGLRFKAVDQSIDVTRQRIDAGECFLASIGSSLVGTALFIPPHRTKGTAWLNRPDVASLHQLAVEPNYQRSGVGRRLMEVVEARAAKCGAVELALDTAEPATHLQRWYASRGYRTIEMAQWAHTNYRSVIMSKGLL